MNGGAGSAIALPCEAELNKVLALSKGEQRCQQTPVGQTNFSWHNSGMNSAIKWVHFGQSFSKLILAIGQQNKFAECYVTLNCCWVNFKLHNSKNHQATRSRLTDENLTTSWSLNWYAFFWFWLAWHFQSNKCMQLSVNAKIQFIIDCLGKKCNRHHQHYVRTTNFWQPSERGTPRFADQVAKPIIYILLYIIYIMRSSAWRDGIVPFSQYLRWRLFDSEFHTAPDSRAA